MIPYDFIYCRAQSLTEALEADHGLRAEGKRPIYYAGGSEIITLCRAGSIRPDAIIDIKNIPECRVLSMNGEELNIGLACTLNEVKESKLFPLLGSACGRIADHTNQCRITLGGNLCGTILYRETSLPLLLSDAKITLFNKSGLRTVAFKDVFFEHMRLNPGELAVCVHVPGWCLQAPYAHVKRTQNEKIDYPLVSMAALWKQGLLRIALSGVCTYPFRGWKMESVLNNHALPCAQRAQQAVRLLPGPAYDDAKGSAQYRLFVLENMLLALLEDWENGQI